MICSAVLQIILLQDPAGKRQKLKNSAEIIIGMVLTNVIIPIVGKIFYWVKARIESVLKKNDSLMLGFRCTRRLELRMLWPILDW